MYRLKILMLFTALIMAFNAKSQSQSEINTSAQSYYEKADAKLNQVYNAILKEYSSNEEFVENLKRSERIWIEFRDAELLVKYPKNDGTRNGSVFPTCYYYYLAELTEARTKTLQQWLDGAMQGDVCSGSIKIAD